MLEDIPEENMDLIYVSGVQSDGMGRLCHYVLKNQHKYLYSNISTTQTAFQSISSITKYTCKIILCDYLTAMQRSQTTGPEVEENIWKFHSFLRSKTNIWGNCFPDLINYRMFLKLTCNN